MTQPQIHVTKPTNLATSADARVAIARTHDQAAESACAPTQATASPPLPLTPVGLDAVVDWQFLQRHAFHDYGSGRRVFAVTAAAAKQQLLPAPWQRRMYFGEFELLHDENLDPFTGEDVEPNGLMLWAAEHRTKCPVCGCTLSGRHMQPVSEKQLPTDGERVSSVNRWSTGAHTPAPVDAVAAADALVCEPCFAQYQPQMASARARIDAFKASLRQPSAAALCWQAAAALAGV